jgi:zinc resistance-associated protein
MEVFAMKKRSFIVMAALAAVLALSAVSFAGPGYGHGRGPGMGFYDNLTPEKQAAVDKIFDKHHKKLVDLREQYWAKSTELEALTASGKAERADIQGLVADLSKVRVQMDQERETLFTELSKETGVKFGRGMGYGPGMGAGGCGGMGPGMGRGMGPGMGYGPAGCPNAD